MKLNSHANALSTNVEEMASQDFGIGDTSVIIDILRNRMYEHKVRTLVQEYICNARDAQREAKATERIQVTVPNMLSPTFKVRDYGLGITPERMQKVFILYGASTKRDSNSQTGGFGIGAKSAWSYTDSFTITTYVDGVKRVYVAHTGVNNQGRLDLLSTTDTDEANGTEIQIAIKPNDWQEFKDSIFRATYFWNETEMPTFKGITAIDLPQNADNDGSNVKISNVRLFNKKMPSYVQDSYHRSVLLIVDGIPYGMDKARKDNHDDNSPINTLFRNSVNGVAIHVDNGAVEVAASRETLAYSKYTIDKLAVIAKDAMIKIDVYINDTFNAVKSVSDWFNAHATLSKLMYMDSRQSSYEGYKLYNNHISSKLFEVINIACIEKRFSRRAKNVSLRKQDVTNIPLDATAKLFYNDGSETAVAQGARIRQYVETNSSAYILTSTPKDTNGVTLATIVKDLDVKDVATLPYVKPVRTPREKKERTKEMITVHTFCHSHTSIDTRTLESFQGDDMVYVYVNYNDKAKMMMEMSELRTHLSETYTFCALTDKVIDIVKDEGTETFIPYDRWKKEWTPDKKLIDVMMMQHAMHDVALRHLKPVQKGIKDKHVVKMIETYSAFPRLDYWESKTLNHIVKGMMAPFVKSYLDDVAKLKELVATKYSLLPYLNYDKVILDEVAWYINTKHKEGE